MLVNAKEELLKVLKNKTIKCAVIYTKSKNTNHKRIDLSINYTEEQYQEFLQKLDFNYPEYFMAIKIVGIIWFENEYKWLEYEFDPITLKDCWILHHKPSMGEFERCINYD